MGRQQMFFLSGMPNATTMRGMIPAAINIR
jgi:hypothetical protein